MSASLEQQLRRANERVIALDGKAAEAFQEAEKLIEEYKAKGVNPAEDKAAFEEVDRAHLRAEKLRDEAADVRSQGMKLATRLGESQGFGGGEATNVRGIVSQAPIGLTGDGIRELFEAAQQGRMARVGGGQLGHGLFALTGTPEFPPSATMIYDLDILAFLQERVRIANFMPIQRVESPRVTFFRATVAADQAGAVAEGADKPESSPVWAEVTVDMVKVAHYGLVTDEVRRDFTAWREVIGAEFVAGLIQEENSQILNGDGTGANMLGLLATPGILSVDRDGTNNETTLDVLLRAITALRTGPAFTDPSVMVLHPDDFLVIRTAKDVNENYLAGNPLTAASDDLWGVPVVVTTSIPEGTALVGNLALGTKLIFRDEPFFEVHPGGGGLAEFKANKTAVRAEERLVAVVTRPAALCEVTLT